uniref:Uncharacterized protein n=1 Tax=Parastrongyloides trichosuri TaxID=131310 RepID=A0A0N4ZKH9_PARTI
MNIIAPSIVFFSWHHGRLIALILNAFGGFIFYAENQGRINNKLNDEEVFTLILIQKQLNIFYDRYHQNGYHNDIYNGIEELSNKAKKLLEINQVSTKDVLNKDIFTFDLEEYKLTDERLRWPLKDLPNVNKREDVKKDGFYFWFQNECFKEFPHNITSTCFNGFSTYKGMIGFDLTSRLQYIFYAKKISNDYLTKHLRTTDSFAINEICANMIDEFNQHKQKHYKYLIKLSKKQRDLLMNQVFACGQFGYLDVSDLHILSSILSWQHPSLGCFSRETPDQLYNYGISKNSQNALFSSGSDTCSSDSTLLGIYALMVYLRFLLEPPFKYREYHLPEQPVNMGHISAEDRFVTFKYKNWVRDAGFPNELRIPKPEPIFWSTDLIAFILILMVALTICTCGHLLNTGTIGRKTKKIYNYAYKKL